MISTYLIRYDGIDGFEGIDFVLEVETKQLIFLISGVWMIIKCRHQFQSRVLKLFIMMTMQKNMVTSMELVTEKL